jgi:hypothetical protein
MARCGWRRIVPRNGGGTMRENDTGASDQSVDSASPVPGAADRQSIGAVMDALTELYRLDLETFGDTRTGHVIRCVAAANCKDGRPAKVSTIAESLDLGLATVHDRLSALARWQDSADATPTPLVHRAPQGYVLTAEGERRLQGWLRHAGRRALTGAVRDLEGAVATDKRAGGA